MTFPGESYAVRYRVEPRRPSVRTVVTLLAVSVSGCGSTAVAELTSPTDVTCAVTVNAPQQVMPSSGGQLSVSMAAARDCLWTASSQTSWLQVSPSSGQGDAVVAVTALLNPTPEMRTGTVIVNETRTTVAQAGAPPATPDAPVVEPVPPSGAPPVLPPIPAPVCSVAISPQQTTIDGQEQSGQITVSVASGCSWSATSTVGWIEITAGSGTGPGTVRYTVDRHRGKGTRTGALVVGGQTFTIVQSGEKDE